MKAHQLQSKSKAELEKDLTGFAARLQQLRFDSSFQKVKNVKEMANLKKDIARVMTLLKQK